VRSLERRLQAAEAAARRSHPEYSGYYEYHYLRAWHEGLELEGRDLRRCDQHTPTCAVERRSVYADCRTVVLEDIDAIPLPD
jgi:hypothetical protein